SESIADFSARRSLPRWRGQWFRDSEISRPRRRGRAAKEAAAAGAEGAAPANAGEGVLLADTFNRYFEPENLRAAVSVLRAAGYQISTVKPDDGSSRPLCCGRTFLAVGRVDEARREAERAISALAPYATRGVPIIGLEPSCLFSFRDEIPAMIKGSRA